MGRLPLAIHWHARAYRNLACTAPQGLHERPYRLHWPTGGCEQPTEECIRPRGYGHGSICGLLLQLGLKRSDFGIFQPHELLELLYLYLTTQDQSLGKDA